VSNETAAAHYDQCDAQAGYDPADETRIDQGEHWRWPNAAQTGPDNQSAKKKEWGMD
jgi:hypothetical protein